MSKLGMKKTLTHNYTPNLPREFMPSFKAKGLLTTGENFHITQRCGSASNIISLSNTSTNAKLAMKIQAQKQKKEILDWLSTENPSPGEVLQRLSKCSTPYAKLFNEACEELSYMHATTRSQKIDDLERESALTSAKTEVEIQQQSEKLIKAKNERANLNEKIKKLSAKLDKINKDVKLLQDLSVYEGIDNEPEQKEKPVELVETELEKKVPPLDENEYKVLWQTRQELLDQIEELKETLKKVQAKQVEEIRNYALRKVNRTPTSFNSPVAIRK